MPITPATHHPVFPIDTAPKQEPHVAQSAPTIRLPLPVPLLPLNEALMGIDRQLARLHIARADNTIDLYDQFFIEKLDRKLVDVYGTTIEKTTENTLLIQDVQNSIKQRNDLANARNLYAQDGIGHQTNAVHGPATERAQKHIAALDNAASALDADMAATLQKGAGRKPTEKIEIDYITAHKALSENRNAWLTGKLDERSKTSLRTLALTDRFKGKVDTPPTARAQERQLRTQLEMNVERTKFEFDHETEVFSRTTCRDLEPWTPPTFDELDSSPPPIATGTQLTVTHASIVRNSDSAQRARIEAQVFALDKDIEQIDRRLKRLSNSRPDPLKPEQLLFIRNTISELRNSWARGLLTQSNDSSIGRLLKKNDDDLLRNTLEQRVTQAKALNFAPTLPVAINQKLSGSNLDIAQSNVKRCDEALTAFDRAIYKAQNSGIEHASMSGNVFFAREAMMKLRNAWAMGEISELPDGIRRHTGTPAGRRHSDLLLQVEVEADIRLHANLSSPTMTMDPEPTVERINRAAKALLVWTINEELEAAYMNTAYPGVLDYPKQRDNRLHQPISA